MKLPDDDELYDVDQTYLGPPGRYIGAMRYKAIFAWLLVAPLLLVVFQRLRVPISLLTIGLTFLLSIYLAQIIADRATSERSVLHGLTSFWKDLSAPRPQARPDVAVGGPAFARARSPRGALGRYLTRRHKR